MLPSVWKGGNVACNGYKQKKCCLVYSGLKNGFPRSSHMSVRVDVSIQYMFVHVCVLVIIKKCITSFDDGPSGSLITQ